MLSGILSRVPILLLFRMMMQLRRAIVTRLAQRKVRVDEGRTRTERSVTPGKRKHFVHPELFPLSSRRMNANMEINVGTSTISGGILKNGRRRISRRSMASAPSGRVAAPARTDGSAGL